VFCVQLVLFDRGKANKTSDGTARETTTKKSKKHNNHLDVYEVAAEVTGVTSLDKNGRLVTTNHANRTIDDGNDVMDTYAEAEIFGGYSPISQVQVSQDDSKSESPIYYNLVARPAQHGAGKTVPGHGGSEGDGSVGEGNDGVMDENRMIYEC